MYKYCIYKTTNLVNGKFYWGVHDSSIGRDYFGSGRKLLLAIKKHGKESFKVDVKLLYKTKREAYVDEALIVTQELVDDRRCYNMALGGNGGALRTGANNSNEHNEKIRKALLGNINALGHKKSDETKFKISNARKGMKFSEEHRLKLSAAQMGNKNALKKEGLRHGVSA